MYLPTGICRAEQRPPRRQPASLQAQSREAGWTAHFIRHLNRGTGARQGITLEESSQSVQSPAASMFVLSSAVLEHKTCERAWFVQHEELTTTDNRPCRYFCRRWPRRTVTLCNLAFLLLTVEANNRLVRVTECCWTPGRRHLSRCCSIRRARAEVLLRNSSTKTAVLLPAQGCNRGLPRGPGAGKGEQDRAMPFRRTWWWSYALCRCGWYRGWSHD